MSLGSKNPSTLQVSDATLAEGPAARRLTHDYEYASMLMCGRCKTTVAPVEDTYPSWKTHLLAGILFCIGLPFCVFLPYCFDCFGEDVLRCPKCGCYINVPSGND